MRILLSALLTMAAMTTNAAEITLIAPGGIRDAIQRMIPEFERASGHTVKATFGSGGGTKQRVIGGELFDVPIVQPPLAAVLATGHVIAASETPLATVPVALAVRKGAAKPDIATADAVRKALLAATRVSFPDGARGAAAGVSFEDTLRKLGIADAMQPKLLKVQGGANAIHVLARGESDIGLTFASEIHNDGVDIVGALPREISTPTALVGYVHAQSAVPAAARALLQYLSSPAAAAIYRALGMVPGR